MKVLKVCLSELISFFDLQDVLVFVYELYSTKRILPTEIGDSAGENLRNNLGSIPCLLSCIGKILLYWKELTSLFFSCIAHKHRCYASFVLNHITWIAFISLHISCDLHISDLERGLLISSFYIVDLISCIHYSHYTISFLLCMKTKWIFALHYLILSCIRRK